MVSSVARRCGAVKMWDNKVGMKQQGGWPLQDLFFVIIGNFFK